MNDRATAVRDRQYDETARLGRWLSDLLDFHFLLGVFNSELRTPTFHSNFGSNALAECDVAKMPTDDSYAKIALFRMSWMLRMFRPLLVAEPCAGLGCVRELLKCSGTQYHLKNCVDADSATCDLYRRLCDDDANCLSSDCRNLSVGEVFIHKCFGKPEPDLIYKNNE